MTRSISRLRASDAGDGDDAHAAEDALPTFELVVAELSARFISLAASAVDGAIVDALRRIVTVLDVDRAQLIEFKGPHAWVTHSWAVEGVPAVPPT